MAEKSIFETLFAIDVSEYVEERKNLTYLSWSHALSEVMKVYPDMNYKVRTFGENNLPYVYDPQTGYMVFTEVTIGDMTKEMWLPVMDTNNKAMKDTPYTYDTKNQKGIKVEAATMFDINKAIMRCLVKNLAAFGLAIYIYNKDDLPEPVSQASEEEEKLLVAKVKEIADAGSALIAAGYKKEDIYSVVAKYNNGVQNPAEITELSVAIQVLEHFADMSKTSTTKKTNKKKNEEAAD